MIQGIYHKISAVRSVMEERLSAASDKTSDPMDSHHAGMLAEISRKDLVSLEGQMQDNEAMVAELTDMITRLKKNRFSSADRTRALCCLEDAQSRLIRDLGTKPADSTMAHYINEGTTLILDGHGSRIGIQKTEENSALCDAICSALSI